MVAKLARFKKQRNWRATQKTGVRKK